MYKKRLTDKHIWKHEQKEHVKRWGEQQRTDEIENCGKAISWNGFNLRQRRNQRFRVRGWEAGYHAISPRCDNDSRLWKKKKKISSDIPFSAHRYKWSCCLAQRCWVLPQRLETQVPESPVLPSCCEDAPRVDLHTRERCVEESEKQRWDHNAPVLIRPHPCSFWHPLCALSPSHCCLSSQT